MQKRLPFILAPLLAIGLLLSFGAGTVTETRTSPEGRSTVVSKINRIELAWTSDSSGNATVTTSEVNGTILRVTFDPAATAPPTDNYDVTLTDANGYDVLAGQGANRDTANTETVVPAVSFTDGTTSSICPIVVAGPLTLSVSNAGNAKQGSVIVYVR